MTACYRAIFLLAALWPGLCQGQAKISIEGEMGPELDTNANRIQSIVVPCPPGASCTNGECLRDSDGSPTGDSCIEGGEEPVTAGLLRVTLSGRYQARLGRHAVSAMYAGGGKLFLSDEARSADEMVHRLNVGWAVLLPSPAVLSLEGAYYDAYQRDSQRDFRTGAAVARLTLGRRGAGLAATASAGYRGLQYKPVEDYSFQGPTAGLDLAATLTRGKAEDLVDWNLSLSYAVGHRRFSGHAEGTPEPCPGRPEDVCNQLSETGRGDLNHVVRAEVNYLGNADASLWYSLELNQSNSYGETFSRHILGLKFTTLVAWGVFLTAKGVLQFSQFRDPYLISRIPNETFLTIEDENRSRLILQLARDLSSQVSINLRYGFYVNESITQEGQAGSVLIPAFLRQTLFLGLRMEWGS